MRTELPVVLAAVLWGLYWVPLRWLETLGVADTAAGALMHGVAALIVLPGLWLSRRRLAEDPVGYALAGLLIAIAFACYSAAVSLTTIINAVLLFYLTPIWIMLIELVFHGTRLSPLRLATVAVGLAGLCIVLGGQGSWLPLPRTAGDWLGLLSGLAWGVAAVVIHHHRRHLQAATTTIVTLPIGGIVALAVHLLLAPAGAAPTIDAGNLPQIVLAVLICQAVILPAIFLSIRGTRDLPPVVITLLLMLEVVIGVVSAALIADEDLGPRQVAGTLLVLVAAGAEPVATVLRRRRAASADPGADT